MFQSNNQNRIIVALDHGISLGVLDGFENPEGTLHRILRGDPDGILCGVPFLRRFQDVINQYPGITAIATLDQSLTSTVPGEDGASEIHHRMFSVATAAELGADAVKTALVYGREDPRVFEHNLKIVADVYQSARERGLPAVVETTLWGRRIENDLDGEKLLHANRIGFETGADVLKTFYPDDPGVFERIVKHSPVPVYVAGGEAEDDDVETLRMVKSVIDAGAAGIMFGRTIWQHDEPAAMIGAIRKVIQEDESASVAAEQLL